MGPFGPMDCVNCQCRSGRIECQRLECPSRPALNCERPVKVAGRCCPVCPLIESDIQGKSIVVVLVEDNRSILVEVDIVILDVGLGPLTSVSSSLPVSGTRSNIQGTAGSSVSRTRTPNRLLTPPSSSSLIKSSTQHGNFSLCLPSDYDVIVYRAQGGGNASEFIQVNSLLSFYLFRS